ncbi:MAG: UDP-N-acetylglucosamine 1-carboxyvinyltransferase, partial [Clostridia bacterium]|nr:UDP-N-acetylglucosamine 1-carboxyvinyltransferase [Clostridia bacterium]
MNHLLIFGGRRLFGTVTAEGAKNAALPILFATLVTGGITILENVPQIEDVRLALSILSQLGAKILPLDAHSYRIDTRECQMSSTPPKEAKKLRGSTYLLGAEAGRFGYGQCVLPGGCNLGERPIDQHIKALQAFGCETKMSEGVVSFRTDGLLGTHFVFDKVSVGATINAILCAVKAKGETILEGVSKEPHVVDLVRYLKSCGASIEGEGTDTIFVSGGKVLHGTTYRIIGDMMEAGTYLIAGVAT